MALLRTYKDGVLVSEEVVGEAAEEVVEGALSEAPPAKDETP
jgi:hypothetical protein